MSCFRRIRDLREDKDMSQQQIANLLNYSQRAYSKMERGDMAISSHVLIKLALFHNTSVDYLLGLTNNPTPYERVHGRHSME